MNRQGTFLGIPYNWNKPSWYKIKQKIWNKTDHKLFIPRAFGWGYTTNFYELLHHRRKLLTGIVFIVVLLGIFVIKQGMVVDRAHSSFENYYAFRGCSQLIKRTETYGICRTGQGQTIKIVKFGNKWYLDGDLPVCLFSLCN